MRHASSPALAALVFWLALLPACPGADAQATVLLLRDDDATYSGVQALRVAVREEGSSDPEMFGPFEINEESGEVLNAQVTPGTRFYVDVIGCFDTEQCDAEDAVARGCSDIEQLETGTTDAIVQVLMHDAVIGNAQCPPPF